MRENEEKFPQNFFLCCGFRPPYHFSHTSSKHSYLLTFFFLLKLLFSSLSRGKFTTGVIKKDKTLRKFSLFLRPHSIAVDTKAEPKPSNNIVVAGCLSALAVRCESRVEGREKKCERLDVSISLFTHRRILFLPKCAARGWARKSTEELCTWRFFPHFQLGHVGGFCGFVRALC